MSTLGYDVNHGFIYEGPSDPVFPVWPTPLVTFATLISTSDDISTIPQDGSPAHNGWVFREDSFDPVSRIRRGRIFEPLAGNDPQELRVEPHPASQSDMRHVHHSHGRLPRTLKKYMSGATFHQIAGRGEGMQLALGALPVYTMWRIVQTELNLQRDVVVTLRAESTFGILPAVLWERVPAMLQARLRASLNRLIDSAYKEQPTSVVDQCRQAACEVIGCWLKALGEANADDEYDLDLWIKKAIGTAAGKEMYILADAANLVRRLHPRGKPNEQAKRQLREVTQGDAIAGIQMIGMLLREVRWALD